MSKILILTDKQHNDLLGFLKGAAEEPVETERAAKLWHLLAFEQPKLDPAKLLEELDQVMKSAQRARNVADSASRVCSTAQREAAEATMEARNAEMRLAALLPGLYELTKTEEG